MSAGFFSPRLVNGRTGDPALYVELRGTGKAVLFDAGRLENLKPAKILRTTHVFLSHCHIDHFIGFDHFLRIALGAEATLRLFGPEGFLRNLEGKLSGYTWNLVEGSRLKLSATEIREDSLLEADFECSSGFARSGPPAGAPARGRLPPLSQGTEVTYAILDHGIPSIAYSLKEPDRLNVDAEALREEGLEPGAWVGLLKESFRRGDPPGTLIDAGARTVELGELSSKLVTATRGQKITYVTDAAPVEENFQKIVALAAGSDLLYCEGAYLEEDRAKSVENKHLTARDAGRLARQAGARAIETFHFSPKYVRRFEKLEEEAGEAFSGR